MATLQDDGSWEEIEKCLEALSIPEQVDWFSGTVQEAKALLFGAHRLADKIMAAKDAGVLREEELDRFAKRMQEIKDLQGMLVLHWSGANSELETLEQLHHIFYPQTRPDLGTALTLLDHMLYYRLGSSIEDKIKHLTSWPQREYWKMLHHYLDSHPDEPAGWREVLAKRGKRTGKKQPDNQ